MNNVRLIAINTLRHIVRMKVLYIGLIVAVLVIAGAIRTQKWIHMAEESADSALISEIQRGSISKMIEVWGTYGWLMGLFIGSVLVSAETKSRTIMSVLARPVSRWQFLAGKCLGLHLFLGLYLTLGMAVGVGFGRFYGISFPPMFWLGLAEQYTTTAYYATVSLGLSAFLSPMAAGIWTVAIPLLPRLIGGIVSVEMVATAADYLVPAQMPANLISESLKKELINPPLRLYAAILVENVLYTVCVFLAGCAIFSRRDVPLK